MHVPKQQTEICTKPTTTTTSTNLKEQKFGLAKFMIFCYGFKKKRSSKHGCIYVGIYCEYVLWIAFYFVVVILYGIFYYLLPNKGEEEGEWILIADVVAGLKLKIK